MRFNWEGKTVIFKGLENNRAYLISGKQLLKAMVKGESMMMLDVKQGDPKLQKLCGNEQQGEELSQLLLSYADIFEFPQ